MLYLPHNLVKIKSRVAYMQDAPIKEKQQLIDKIKSVTNILVTVSRDPSVDDLSAALGLTMLLNKVGKHATAIFSGAIPPAITFLEPDKVFENTIDSLRDFIIALDKEKADHLRYKVDGDVVKIFITPYRTVITDQDLQFSQGNYNVELVLALGVESQEHLDLALAAHGQILHDVTVMTLSSGRQVSRLGTLDWYDSSSSCLCEMITSLSDLLKIDKSLLDKQISTALLTGIVAATERFSNNKTSASTMTLAAQLMAAGADQQLIASKLQETHQITSIANTPSSDDVSTSEDEVVSTPPSEILSIDHTHEEPEPVKAPVQAPVVVDDPVVVSTLPPEPEPPKIILDSKESPVSIDSLENAIISSSGVNVNQSIVPEPRVDNILADDIVLGHGSPQIGKSPTLAPPSNISDGKLLDILDNNDTANSVSTLPPEENRADALEAARGAVMSAVESAPASNPIASPGLPLQPVVAPPVDLPLPPPVPNYFAPATPTTPDFGVTVSSESVAPAPENNDPAQFKIPGQ